VGLGIPGMKAAIALQVKNQALEQPLMSQWLSWNRPVSPQSSCLELAVRCARPVAPRRRKRRRRCGQSARSLDPLPLLLRPLELRRAA
jgi:hypothetical protein